MPHPGGDGPQVCGEVRRGVRVYAPTRTRVRHRVRLSAQLQEVGTASRGRARLEKPRGGKLLDSGRPTRASSGALPIAETHHRHPWGRRRGRPEQRAAARQVAREHGAAHRHVQRLPERQVVSADNHGRAPGRGKAAAQHTGGDVDLVDDLRANDKYQRRGRERSHARRGHRAAPSVPRAGHGVPQPRPSHFEGTRHVARAAAPRCTWVGETGTARIGERSGRGKSPRAVATRAQHMCGCADMSGKKRCQVCRHRLRAPVCLSRAPAAASARTSHGHLVTSVTALSTSTPRPTLIDWLGVAQTEDKRRMQRVADAELHTRMQCTRCFGMVGLD